MRKVGQRYKDRQDGQVYILALADGATDPPRASLINLRNGNRWQEASPVRDTQDISEDEWASIAGATALFVRLKGYPK